MYKLVNGFDNKTAFVIRTSDNTSIPLVDDNTDYQEYLAWLDEGNEPLPADEE
jgi:hypothetical protein